MSALVIESFADVAAWTSRDAQGGASTSVRITADGPVRLPGLSAPGATVVVDAGASGHAVQRSGNAVDLRAFSDLQLWVRSARVADGTAARPLFAEVRLGSAAMPISSQANNWRRLIPIDQAAVWQPAPMSLDDLPDAVRHSLTTIRITCLDGSTAWRLDVDAILAVRPELLADADSALLARLDNTLSLDGAPVPALLTPFSGPAPASPYLRISNYDVRPDRATSPTVPVRTDYTETGYVLRPPASVFELDYAVEALVTDRASAARMLQHVLAQLTPTSRLLGGGRLMTVDWVDQPATAAPPVIAPPADHPVVHLRVRAGQPATAPAQRAVPPFHEISVEADQRA